MRAALFGTVLTMIGCSISARAEFEAELDPAYRHRVHPVERPLVLEYVFPGEAGDRVRLHVVNYPGRHSDLFFLHLHMNETTARSAGAEAVRANGGTLMVLTHSSGARHVQVRVGSRRYRFDPNRIFTEKGLTEGTVPRPVGNDLVELRRFVSWVKRNLQVARSRRAHPMVISLHNNTDDDVHGELLSIRTERRRIGIDNEAVNVNPAWDIDNFYIASQRRTYDRLIARHDPNISLLLERPRDLGHLSSWAIREGIDFLSVETESGDLEANRRMLAAVQSSLR